MRRFSGFLLFALIAAMQAADFDNASAASGNPVLAPDSVVTATGTDLALQDVSAEGFPLPRFPLPTELGGVSIQVVDSAGAARLASLYRVSPAKIQYVLPAGTAPGMATVNIMNDGVLSDMTAQIQVQAVAPSLFSANGDGQGVAEATAVRMVIPTRIQNPVTVFQCADQPGSCQAVPIDPGLDAPVTLTFYGTGIRGAQKVIATIGGEDFQVLYAGPDATRPGVDQVIVPLTLALRGRGLVDVIVTADGGVSNPVQISVQ
jgi:uncharacterized protein (TIGR03437 family)